MQDLPRANYRQRSLQGKRARHRACPLTRPNPVPELPTKTAALEKKNSCRQLSKEKPCNNHVKTMQTQAKKNRKHHAKSSKKSCKQICAACCHFCDYVFDVFFPKLVSRKGRAPGVLLRCCGQAAGAFILARRCCDQTAGA